MHPSPDNLRRMLEQDRDSIEQLHQLLETEREHLEARRHTELTAILEAKEPLLAQLGDHSRQRQQWLEQAGLSRDHSGWEQLLKASTDTSDMLDPWRELTARFEQCQELNDINGKIIGRSRQTLGQLLNILRGQVGGPQLYNAQGATAPEGGSQTIVKA